MTSLAKQLQRLAVPHTQEVLAEDKRKASLLFDPKEAASIDKDTFHALGRNGLQELENIDEDFHEFNSSLFGDTSLTFQRSVQTKEVNEKIDGAVQRFLVRLSPYCLLRPAHKALEWLINRFQIHLYNTDELIMCFLPYHESKIFVRMLQLIRFDSKLASKWDWLQPLQKSGVSLSKKTLVNHCSTNPAFLSYVCEMVNKAVKVLMEKGKKAGQCRVLFSFYATTLIAVLDSVPVTEQMLSSLLPHLSRGLTSSVLEFKAASYMILAQLLHKAQLKPVIIKALQKIIVKGMVVELMGEAMACLLLMFQTQDMTSIKLLKKTFRYLCMHYGVIDTVCELATQFDSNGFLTAFLDRLIPAAFKHAVGIATSGGETSESDSQGFTQEYMSMLHRLLSNIQLAEDIAEHAAYMFLRVYVKHGHVDDDLDGRIKDSLQGIVRQLEGRHSVAVDRAVTRMMSECESEDARELVQEFLNLYVLSVPHQLVTDSETSLVLSLNHRLPSVRKKAVTALVKNKHEVEDATFLKDSLCLRLQDDDATVVKAALQVGKDVWSVVKDDKQVIQLLQKPVLMGLEKDSWRQAALQATRILASYDGDAALEVITSYLPCFFMREGSEFSVKIQRTLLTSTMAKNNTLLKNIADEWKRTEPSVNERDLNANMCHCVAEGLLGYVAAADFDIVSKWSQVAMDTDDIRVPCLMMVALDHLISTATVATTRLSLCHLQIGILGKVLKSKNLGGAACRSDDLSSKWEKFLMGKVGSEIPLQMCLKSLYTVVSGMKLPSSLADGARFWQLSSTAPGGEVSLFLRLCVLVYGMLLENVMTSRGEKTVVQVYRDLLKLFEKTCFSSFKTYLKFLSLLWTQHANDLADDLGMTLTLQVKSLRLGQAVIKNIGDESKDVLYSSPDVLVSVLLVLTSSCAMVREAGLHIVPELLSHVEEKGVYSRLLKKIVTCQGEILSDPSYISQVVLSVFESSSQSKQQSPTKKQRGRKSVGAQHTEQADWLQGILGVVVGAETPCYIQHALLQVLELLNSGEVLIRLLPLMSRHLQQDQNSLSKMAAACLVLLMRRFTPSAASCLAPGSQALQLFLKVIQQQTTSQQCKDGPSLQMVAISQVTKELYQAVEKDAQHSLLSALFDACVNTEVLDVANEIRKVVKHLRVDGGHIQAEMKKVLKLSTATTVRQAKRQKKYRSEDDGGVSEFDSHDWQRVTIILEAVHTKKKIVNYTELVPICFQMLASILESENHLSAEYIKQLIFGLLFNICGRMERQEEGDEGIVPEKQFNMELIVNCIRSSDNPQTHHHALLLLTSAAKIYPEHLLHNMMSVFTFMGANIMRQDDAYSLLITSKILETVIPALITACKQRKHVPKGITNDLEDIITMVIQVFVDSYKYIPEHRRHLLFQKLLTVIGEGQYLWRTLLLMMDHVVTKGTLRAELATDAKEMSSDVEFCLALCSEFSATVQLSSAREMITYLLKLPDDKEEDDVSVKRKVPQSLGKLHKEDAKIFNVALHTGKQLRYFKYASVHLLVTLFSGTDFIAQVAESVEADLLGEFRDVLETVLQLVTHVTMVTNRTGDKATSKFWKALQHKVHDLLDKLVSLLPDSMFLEVIGGLVSHDLPTIQRKAMDLLNTKLQQQRVITEQEGETLLPLVDQLRLLVNGLCVGREITEEGSVNAQTAFISLKLLCRNIGHQNAPTFIKVLKTAVDVFRNGRCNQQVCACALLCIAEICHSLKAHVIQHLSSFMPALLATMADTETLIQNELYVMSVVTAVNRVVESLAHFLSPYLLDIITHVCILCNRSDTVEVLQKPQVQMRLKTIRSTLSTSLPTRILLPAVRSCYNILSQTDLMCVSSLMALIGDHVNHIPREDLISHLTQLQAFFIESLNIREDHPELKEKKIAALEGVTIDTIISMVMKLSEAMFKPFLFKLFDWATSADEHRERTLVFYRLAERLSEKLRSLFTLFAGHIINHAAKTLEMNNSMIKGPKYFPSDKSHRKKSCQLLVYILDCLYKCCLYDTEGFITRERFDILMQPLVDQLENMNGGEERYTSRVTEHLVPCIVQLTVAGQDDTLWRALNYQVCLKTRSQIPQVRSAALEMVDQLHKKMGEDYMPLLPDTIPFLAELMEDESEDVENKCQAVMREMEKTLGEPLQKYF